MEDIENEARVAESLVSCRHRNIVHILRHNWLPNSFNRWYYIDMELCSFSLEVYISMHKQSDPFILQSTLGPPEINPKNWPVVCEPGCSLTQRFFNMWTIGSHIASGLQHLHAQKCVHRDLKPGNGTMKCTSGIVNVVIVLYSASDNVWKLTDFGVSAEATSKAARSTRYSRGTSSYRAPELLLDEPHFSNKTDIWALGCILHELATGRSLFREDWRVRLYHLGQETLSLDLPLCDPFFQRQVSENILDLLNKDYRNRPSATRAKEIFENYCWFLAHDYYPGLRQIPSYHRFHIMLDLRSLEILRSARSTALWPRKAWAMIKASTSGYCTDKGRLYLFGLP
jgi:serine/threonine protein kinase